MKPRIDSSATRYIQAAEPVYQVQPPRPTCGVDAVDVGGDDVRLDLDSVATFSGVSAWLTGLSISSSGAARSRLPSSARARTTQSAACVYWPPFSRMPGT